MTTHKTARRPVPPPTFLAPGPETESEVNVYQYHYRVDWGPMVRPRIHYVGKNRVCDCDLGKNCPSVERVSDYLKAGGERAPEYPADYWPQTPEQCPVCGANCENEPRLTTVRHGVGWACSTAGTLHYWEARTRAIQPWFTRQWLYESVYDEHGRMLYAGIDLRAASDFRMQAPPYREHE